MLAIIPFRNSKNTFSQQQKHCSAEKSFSCLLFRLRKTIIRRVTSPVIPQRSIFTFYKSNSTRYIQTRPVVSSKCRSNAENLFQFIIHSNVFAASKATKSEEYKYYREHYEHFCLYEETNVIIVNITKSIILVENGPFDYPPSLFSPDSTLDETFLSALNENFKEISSSVKEALLIN